MRDGTRTPIHITYGPAMLEFVKTFDAENEGLHPQLLPTIIPPKDWNAHGEGGGYHSLRKPLVRRHKDPAIRDHPAGEQMAKAVNLVQRTAWTVNQRVLRAMQQAWDEGKGIGKLPAPPPQTPSYGKSFTKTMKAAGSDKAKLKALWAEFRAHRKQTGQYYAAGAVIKAATACASFERIYFPHQLDFRGRFNAIPGSLNPQGNKDYTRALLTFAEGQPMKSEEDADWLAIHGANCWGLDKLTFKARLAFVKLTEEDILKVAQSPQDHTWWQQTHDGEPWQFLAFCFEWSDLVEYRAEHDGSCVGFVSSLPIALDCTCSGIQHYAALLGDERTGVAVNLVELEAISVEDLDDDQGRPIPGSQHEVVIAPSEVEPRDIYSDVVQAVTFTVRGEETRATRKLAKDIMMPWGYGAGKEHVWKTVRRNHPEITGEENEKAESVFDAALADKARAVSDGMKWFRALVKQTKKQPIKWRTPSGFEVIHYYPKPITTRIRLTRRRRLTIRTGEADYTRVLRKQRTALAPNFVHSLDACLLAESVVRAFNEYGITNFGVVHDSFATTAAQVEEFRLAIFDRFRWLYSSHAPLEDFRARVAKAFPGVEVPPVPRGDGRLNLSRLSPYFCS